MVLGVAGLLVATQAMAQITFYEGEGFGGQAFTADRTVWDLDRTGFNDRARSVVVNSGSWEVCSDARFEGRCVTLQPGNYDSLRSMGLDERISSVRPADRVARYDNGAPPDYRPPVVAAAPAYGYPSPPDERLYQAPVTSVHAVVGPPEQRCWVERQQVDRGPNVPGAIAGAVIGGILGHQVGGGHGRDVATVGGAVAGGAIGANVGRGDQTTQDVQRCENVQGQQQPDYWDVTYNFRGVEHRVQMTAPPGATLTVDANGDPRA
jgi:uncharacterized protein YcfJ